MVGSVISHYHVLEPLGRGGMGVVYKAEDIRLGRFVALKFLPEGMARDRTALERFRREARAASALNHPNICTIHDIDEGDGQPFLVMELLEGQTLAHLLPGRPLETGRIIEWGVEMCSALQAAHAKGIVHRDIKPGNIFITDSGQVKALDFGLAKLAAAPAAAATGTDGITATAGALTGEGMALGTLLYMSPEQLLGKPLDARTDLFSLGVVLYEMATGVVPFRRESAAAIAEAILHAQPLAAVRLNPSLPPKLEEIIGKALEKDRDLRYHSAAELRTDLKRLQRESETGMGMLPAPRRMRLHARWATGFALAVVLAAGIVAGYFATRGRSAIDSIAVLPFTNVTADPNTEYLADGMADTLIDNLSQLPRLAVKARSSVFRYKGREVDPQQVGRDLGVRAVLLGRLTEGQDNVRISVELVDARNDNHLWGEDYTRPLADLSSLQQAISRDVSDKLRLKLTGAEQARLSRHTPENSEAYALYLKGRFYWNKRGRQDLNRAVDYFNQAIAKEPDYALAYAGLADCYNLLGFTPERKGIKAARRALELDDSLAEAHASLAFGLLHADWDFAGAEKEYRRAIALDPNYATAHQWYASELLYLGRNTEAVTQAEQAVNTDPLSVPVNTAAAIVFRDARDYPSAEQQFRKALELDPNFASARHWLARTYYEQGKYDQYLAEEHKASALEGRQKEQDAEGLARAYARSGYRGLVEQQLEIDQREFNAASEDERPKLLFYIAGDYAQLGDKDKAFAYLNQVLQAHDPMMIILNVSRDFDNLHGDPRFLDLERRVGLPVSPPR